MSERKTEGKKPYDTTGFSVLAKQQQKEGAHPEAAHRFIEIIQLSKGLDYLLSVDIGKKTTELFRAMSMEYATKKGDNALFTGDVVKEEMEAGTLTWDGIPDWYEIYLKSKGLYDIFMEKIVIPRREELRREVMSVPLDYNMAEISETIMKSDVPGYIAYATMGIERDEKNAWKNFPYLDRWIYADETDNKAPYTNIIGDSGTGKTTLIRKLIRHALTKGKWVITNLPVETDRKKHLFHVTKLHDVVPIWLEFQQVRQHIREYDPTYQSNLLLVVDEKRHGRTSTLDAENMRVIIKIKRHLPMAIFEASVDRDDPLLENFTNYFGFTEVKGDRHQLLIEGTPDGKVNEIWYPTDENPLETEGSQSDDRAPPFNWDIDWEVMENELSERIQKPLKDCTWAELQSQFQSWYDEKYGELSEAKEEDEYAGVAVCPGCLTRLAYNSKRRQSKRCSKCKEVFIVDPIKSENFYIRPDEAPERPEEEKRKWIGVTVCPFCGEIKPYDSFREKTEICSQYNKPYTVDPNAKKNWKALDNETEKVIQQEVTELKESNIDPKHEHYSESAAKRSRDKKGRFR